MSNHDWPRKRIVEVSRQWTTLLIVLFAALVCAPNATAQDEPIEQRILKPLGRPTKPVGLNPLAFPALSGSPGLELPKMTGQLPGLPISGQITFREFMRQVETSNLVLAAERYNVPIAESQLVAAQVYPDPTFQAGYAGDLSGNRHVTAYSGGLSQTILLGGKIRARKQSATAALRESDALLADYLRILRAQAADAFIDGLIGALKLEREEKALQRSHQLVELNTMRLRKKEISEDEVMRARIGELEAKSDLFDAESALHETLGGLIVLMGARQGEGLVVPQGNLEEPPRTFTLQTLVNQAVASRYDVVAARYALEQAQAQYRVAQADRIPDLTLGGTYAHLTRVTNPIDPSPAWDGAGVSLSIPIPFSNLNRGSLEAANFQVLQSEKLLQAAQLQTETDVRTAYEQYILSVAGAQEFATELLHDADQVYKSRLFKLEKGTVTLVDVLDAHNALDQLYIDYYNALSRRAKALVALEQAAGTWDVDF